MTQSFSAESISSDNKLLHSRLKACCIMLLIAIVASSIRSFFNPYASFYVVNIQLFALAINIGIFFFLHKRKSLTKRTLKIIEIIVFSSALIVTLILDLSLMVVSLDNHDKVYAALSIQHTISASHAILIIYGLFIPKPWHEAMIFIVIIVLTTFLTLLTVVISHLWIMSGLILPILFSIRTLTYLGIGMFCAIYGSHTIYSLQKESAKIKAHHNIHD